MLDSARTPTFKAPGRAIFARHRYLLRLLDALGGKASNLDFQKLLFLACQESGPAPPYDFVPYKFGAFSFTSYADRRKLIANGYLVNDAHSWELTKLGAQLVGDTPDMQLAEFAHRHRHIRGDALVADTYRRFPFHATRSEISTRVLRGDTQSLARIESARTSESSQVVHTIGYEGHSLESYLNALLRAGVTQLYDVRRNALSRKYGFSKNTLLSACISVGIHYEHIPELGVASEKRQQLRSQADYDALFREYKRDWLPTKEISIQKLAECVSSGRKIALTCYEHLPTQCHRACVAQALEKQLGTVQQVRHL
jgi:uncharacterized protein (DUF488 family)